MKVSISEVPQSEFELLYLTVREKEGRVYSDEKVIQLPHLKKGDAHYKEWRLRAKSLKRFLNYLAKYHSDSRLLEVGCGNGWFSNHCAKIVQDTKGIDVNTIELEQANRLFQAENLAFYYWDIFTASPFKEQFDLIVLNASIQYFPDIDKLISRLKELLRPNGEIHILDSPFYEAEELEAARQRTHNYYNGMNVPAMNQHYFHHLKNKLKNFTILYASPSNKLLSALRGKDSPFSWYRLKND